MTSITLERPYAKRSAVFRSSSDDSRKNTNSIKPEHILGFFIVAGGLIVGLQMKIENTKLKSDNSFLRTELADAGNRTVQLSVANDGLINAGEMADSKIEAYEEAYKSMAFTVDSFRTANESLTAQNNEARRELQAAGSKMFARSVERDGMIFRNDLMQAKLDFLEETDADKKLNQDSSVNVVSFISAAPN